MSSSPAPQLQRPDVEDAGDQLHHYVCSCDQDIALCGQDVSMAGSVDVIAGPEACVVCVDLQPRPCRRCGS